MVMEKFSALYFNFWLLCTICCHRSSNFLRYSAQTLFYSLECNKCRQSHSCPAVHYCRSTTWLAINYILVQNNKSTFHLLPFPFISFAFFSPLLSFFFSFHFLSFLFLFLPDVKLLNNYNESALDSAVAAGHHSLVER